MHHRSTSRTNYASKLMHCRLTTLINVCSGIPCCYYLALPNHAFANFHTLTVQITWRGYWTEKRAKRDRIMKQKEQEFLRRQRSRTRDAVLMDWIDTLNITVYQSASSNNSKLADQDEEGGKSWKAPGIVARAFSVYSRLDWTDRTEGIRMAGAKLDQPPHWHRGVPWRFLNVHLPWLSSSIAVSVVSTGKYMQLRGWWTGGKDGYFGDEEVKRLVKLESGWKAAGVGFGSQRFEYMFDGIDDYPAEGAKNGGMWHGTTTAKRGFEYFPANTSHKEPPAAAAAAAAARHNRDGGIAYSSDYGNLEEAKIAAYRGSGRRDEDGAVRDMHISTHGAMQSPMSIRHFQNPAAGRASPTFHPLFTGDGVSNTESCTKGVSLRFNGDASEPAQSCSFYNAAGHYYGTETEAGPRQVKPGHVMEDRLRQHTSPAGTGPGSEETLQTGNRTPKKPAGENRGRRMSPRKSRIKTAPDRRRGKNAQSWTAGVHQQYHQSG